jgi:hypothetical protein
MSTPAGSSQNFDKSDTKIVYFGCRPTETEERIPTEIWLLRILTRSVSSHYLRSFEFRQRSDYWEFVRQRSDYWEFGRQRSDYWEFVRQRSDYWEFGRQRSDYWEFWHFSVPGHYLRSFEFRRRAVSIARLSETIRTKCFHNSSETLSSINDANLTGQLFETNTFSENDSTPIQGTFHGFRCCFLQICL